MIRRETDNSSLKNVTDLLTKATRLSLSASLWIMRKFLYYVNTPASLNCSLLNEVYVTLYAHWGLCVGTHECWYSCYIITGKNVLEEPCILFSSVQNVMIQRKQREPKRTEVQCTTSFCAGGYFSCMETEKGDCRHKDTFVWKGRCMLLSSL